jgi:hexosaminidase
MIKTLFITSAMISTRAIPLALFILSMSTCGFAEPSTHSSLLPRPQNVSFVPGQLDLHGVYILLPAGPSPEDAFSAQQLSACLASRTQQEVPVGNLKSSGIAIHLHRSGPVDPLPAPGETPGPKSREAYSILVNPQGAWIEARSSAGLFYGIQTMCQLVEVNSVLPAVKIEDWPAQAYRGVMVDMSEGPLPTEGEIKRQLNFLAGWKVNQYFFYSEASIELSGYPLLNPEGRFTRQQIASIVAYARERHIDVIPCLELYGHLHDLFRIEKYSPLADFPHGGEFNPRDPRVMQLLTDWAGQFASMFPSRFAQIGFDETWQIQQAAARQGNKTTAVDLFIEQLSNVSRVFEQRHKTVMAWADIMVKYPGIVEKLPSGTIAVAWYYDPRPDPDYRHWLDPLVQHKIPFFVAPGVNSWSEIYPDYDLTFANIDTFVAAGRRLGALGVMNTIWTDDAQMLMRLSWPGMAYGAIAAWQSAPVDRISFFANYARQRYPEGVAADLASALAALNSSEIYLQQALGQNTMDELWRNPFAPSQLARSRSHQADLRQSRLLAEQAEEALSRIPSDAGSIEDLTLAARLLDYAGLKFLYAVEIDVGWRTLGLDPSSDRVNAFIGSVTSQQHGRLPDLMDVITDMRPNYEKAWLAEYSPYRLASALGRWDAEYENWHRIQGRLEAYSGKRAASASRPALQSLLGTWE